MSTDKDRNILFLIGNGFDLHHKLKTTYKDFLNAHLLRCIKEASEKNLYYNDGFISVRINHPHNFQSTFDKLSSVQNPIFSEYFVSTLNQNYSNYNIHQTFDIYVEDRFIKNLILNCNNLDWNGIEHSIFVKLKECYFSVFKPGINENSINYNLRTHESVSKRIEKLNKSVDYLKRYLLKYLENENNPYTEYFSIFNNISFLTNDFTHKSSMDRKLLFLNFNYTNYLNTYSLKHNYLLNRNPYIIDVINIHGTLNDKDEAIFGIGDEQFDLYRNIETHLNDAWLYTMKSFWYLRSQNYQNLLGFINSGEYEVFILGHSCGITDRTLLNMIFENDSCKKIHVFHYDGLKSYMKTAYNISRNFNNKVKLRNILQPFDKHLTM